jgi:uncharacterized membrane protein
LHLRNRVVGFAETQSVVEERSTDLMGQEQPDRLDRAFAIGIFLKGLNGVAEIVGGTILLFATPAVISQMLTSVTGSELAEDPTDFLAIRLRHFAASDALSAGGIRFAAIYLLAHGIVKVALVTAVLKGRSWAYPSMIVFLVCFIAYQLFRLSMAPTTPLIALTVFDAVLVCLAWRQWRNHQPNQVDND